MKIKNSYVKLGLWLLVGAAIGAASSIIFIKLGKMMDFSSADSIYKAIVSSTMGIQLVILGVIGGYSLILWRKTKKWIQLVDWEEEGEEEKKIERAQNQILVLSSINLALQFLVFGIGLDKNNPHFLATTGIFVAATAFMACMEIAVIKQVKILNPLKKGDPAELSFAKSWENSCDEAERLQMYRCGFKVFQVTKYALMFGMLAAIIGKLHMGTGNMAILLLGVIMLAQNISYGYFASKG